MEPPAQQKQQQQQQQQRSHRVRKAGRKAERKHKREAAKRDAAASGGGTDGGEAAGKRHSTPANNPRAFAFSGAGRARASAARTAEKEQRRLHGALQEWAGRSEQGFGGGRGICLHRLVYGVRVHGVPMGRVAGWQQYLVPRARGR